jgi:hypothetical protein
MGPSAINSTTGVMRFEKRIGRDRISFEWERLSEKKSLFPEGRRDFMDSTGGLKAN